MVNKNLLSKIQVFITHPKLEQSYLWRFTVWISHTEYSTYWDKHGKYGLTNMPATKNHKQHTRKLAQVGWVLPPYWEEWVSHDVLMWRRGSEDDGVVPLVPFFIMHALLHNQLQFLFFSYLVKCSRQYGREREKKAFTGVPSMSSEIIVCQQAIYIFYIIHYENKVLFYFLILHFHYVSNFLRISYFLHYGVGMVEKNILGQNCFKFTPFLNM